MAGIGLLGHGNVGGSVFKILSESRSLLAERAGAEIAVRKVLVRNPAKHAAAVPKSLLTSRFDDVLNDPEISIVVELIGREEPALTFIKESLHRGKSVVTANKEVISKHGPELFDIARRCQARLLFEGSVCGGIPIVRPLQDCLVANRVSSIAGILNGTTNYILSRMDESEMELAEALGQAQALGYAESDPSDDLTGTDAARKLSILASIAFGAAVSSEEVKTSGIGDVGLADIRYAKELGYKVKLVARAWSEGGPAQLTVGPTLVSAGHPLASVSGPFNAVLVESSAAGTLMFYGQGAGGMPTASAVVGDIIDIVRNHSAASRLSPAQALAVAPAREVWSQFYIRLKAADCPGVLSKISGVMGENDISLSMVLQKNSVDGVAEVVLVTHNVKSGNVEDAIDELRGCDEVPEVCSLLRVWG